jgi:hypothetical protein
MTSLLNPNDIENRNRIIKNIEICYEEYGDYTTYNRNFLMIFVNKYCEKHLNLEIDKEDLLEYLKKLYINYIFNKLTIKYNRVRNINEINEYNEYLLSLMNNISDNFNKDIYKIIEPIFELFDGIIHEREIFNENNLIYYSIYNLDNSIKIINENIKNNIEMLKNDSENYLNLIKELKETNEILNNTIKDLKEMNDNQMNIIKGLVDERQSINKFDNRCERY